MAKKKMNSATFIKRCIEVHGDLYGYEYTTYTSYDGVINFVCKRHGVVSKRADAHLQGQGCPKCGRDIQKSKVAKNLLTFIDEANIIHNGIFDYSQVIYVNTKTLVCIVCPIHGKFEQLPTNHLAGQGCPYCYQSRNRLSLTDFLEKARSVHGNRYDYSLIDSLFVGKKVIIFCPVHQKVFEQLPAAHLFGRGCLDCGYEKLSLIQRKPLDLFIYEAGLRHHNKYDYTKVVYINATAKIEIVCPIHGSFWQRPGCHLYDGNGCPKCAHRVSYVEVEWLNYLGIPNDHLHRQVKLLVGSRIIIADGFVPETKTLYEFYGDKWHGNPAVYDQLTIDDVRNISYGEIYSRTMERESAIKNAGYNIISVWEKDWRSHDETRICIY